MHAAVRIMYQIPCTSVGNRLHYERSMKLMDGKKNKNKEICVHKE